MKSFNHLIMKRGFTLIEILVGMSIFSLVAGMITSLTLDIIQAERVASSNQVALDSSRFILQRIAKAIRVSVVKTPSSNATSTIELDHPRRGTIDYFWNTDHRIVERIGGDPNTDSYLDSSRVTIEDFHFKIQGADNGTDNRQPQVTIILKIKPPKAKRYNLPSLTFQTTLSQRCLDEASSCRAY